MKQNIYDNSVFFNGYKNLRNNESGLNAAVEEPAVEALLPNPEGKSVLDLGCGFGGFCRQLRAWGADSVTGVEISCKMLTEARKQTVDRSIVYHETAIEDYTAPDSSYDLITARLVMHYIKEYPIVIRNIARMLHPRGTFIMSFEHPICTSAMQGWHCDETEKQQFWPVDRYQDEGIRTHHWFVDDVVKYHRTMATYINTVIDAGLTIKRLLEPEPLEEYLKQRPELDKHRRRPPIAVLSAVKE